MELYDSTPKQCVPFAPTWDGMVQACLSPVSEDEIRAAEKALGVGFPASYRLFLREFGAGTVHRYDLFGLPRDHLWGDIVMMNQLASRSLPRHYVKITEDLDGRAFYLDTSRMDLAGECPVVAFGGGANGRIIAACFADFLRRARDDLL
jgi:hypothetical protein